MLRAQFVGAVLGAVLCLTAAHAGESMCGPVSAVAAILDEDYGETWFAMSYVDDTGMLVAHAFVNRATLSWSIVGERVTDHYACVTQHGTAVDMPPSLVPYFGEAG